MKRRCLGVPAFLILIVFSLSGISVGLFSMAIGTVVEELVVGQVSAPAELLLRVPIIGWMAAFFGLGVIAAWFFEKSERLKGEVPCRSAGLVAIIGLVMVLGLLVGFASPLMEHSGEVASRTQGSHSAIPAHEDGPHLELATQ